MPAKDFLFTSESVSEGHPDKMCDQISDAILDALIAQDPDSRVACETLAKTGMVVVAGEITTRAIVNYSDVVREVVQDIGYTSSELGFDATTCSVLSAIGQQSPDISQGVTEGEGLHKEQGAGDQGMPCVLVELAFLTHADEVQRLGSATYQETLAEGLFHGIADFLRTGLSAKNL